MTAGKGALVDCYWQLLSEDEKVAVLSVAIEAEAEAEAAAREDEVGTAQTCKPAAGKTRRVHQQPNGARMSAQVGIVGNATEPREDSNPFETPAPSGKPKQPEFLSGDSGSPGGDSGAENDKSPEPSTKEDVWSAMKLAQFAKLEQTVADFEAKLEQSADREAASDSAFKDLQAAVKGLLQEKADKKEAIIAIKERAMAEIQAGMAEIQAQAEAAMAEIHAL